MEPKQKVLISSRHDLGEFGNEDVEFLDGVVDAATAPLEVAPAARGIPSDRVQRCGCRWTCRSAWDKNDPAHAPGELESRPLASNRSRSASGLRALRLRAVAGKPREDAVEDAGPAPMRLDGPSARSPVNALPKSGFDARQVVGVRAEGRRVASCRVIEPVAAFAGMRTGQAAPRGRGKGYSVSVSGGRSGGGPGMLHHFSEEMRLSLDALEDRPPA